MTDDRHVDFFEDVLVLAEVTEGVFAPPGCPAAVTGEILVGRGKTGGADVRVLSEVDGFVQGDDGQVVVQGAGVELGVHVDVGDVAFDVREEFDVVVDVPFPESDAEVVRRVPV